MTLKFNTADSKLISSCDIRYGGKAAKFAWEWERQSQEQKCGTHTKRRNCCYILWPIYGSNAATNTNIVSASIILFYALVVHRHEINCTGEKLVPTIYLGEGIHEIDGKARRDIR